MVHYYLTYIYSLTKRKWCIFTGLKRKIQAHYCIEGINCNHHTERCCYLSRSTNVEGRSQLCAKDSVGSGIQ